MTTRAAFDIVGIIGIVVSIGLAIVGWSRDAEIPQGVQTQIENQEQLISSFETSLAGQVTAIGLLDKQIAALDEQVLISKQQLKLAEATEYRRLELEFRDIQRLDISISEKLAELEDFATRSRPARDTKNPDLLGLFVELDQSISARRTDLAAQEAAIAAAEARVLEQQEAEARAQAEARADQARKDEEARLAAAEAARRAEEERANAQREQEFLRALQDERICLNPSCTNWIFP